MSLNGLICFTCSHVLLYYDTYFSLSVTSNISAGAVEKKNMGEIKAKNRLMLVSKNGTGPRLFMVFYTVP